MAQLNPSLNEDLPKTRLSLSQIRARSSNSPNLSNTSSSFKPLFKLGRLDSTQTGGSLKLNDTLNDNSRKNTSPTKSQLDFTYMKAIPVIIKDQEYLKRKQTFDTFLREKDMELMMGVTQSPKKAVKIDRNTSLANISVLHSKMKSELNSKLRNKKGKMYANELWAVDYYNTVIKSSKLKTKFDNLSDMKFKSIDLRTQEFEEFYQKKMTKILNTEESSIQYSVQNQSIPTLMTATQPNELLPLQEESSPKAGINLRRKRRTLQSFLQDLTPKKATSPTLTKNNIESHSIEYQRKSTLGDWRDNRRLLTRTSLDYRRGSKLMTSPQNSQFDPEKKNGESPVFLSEASSGVTSPIHSRGSTSPVFSFNGSKLVVKSKFAKNNVTEESPHSPQTSFSFKNIKKPTTPIYERQIKFHFRPSKVLDGTDTVQKKMETIIDKLFDLSLETKEFEKEVKEQEQDLKAFRNRKEIRKVNLKERNSMVEALARNAHFRKFIEKQRADNQ